MKDRADLVEKIADAVTKANGSDTTYEEDKTHFPAAAKWAEEIAMASLTAIQDAGYVLVPGEPTEEMLQKGSDFWALTLARNLDWRGDARGSYQAMIAASPLREGE